MATKLVQVTDVEQAITLWKQGMLRAVNNSLWVKYEDWCGASSMHDAVRGIVKGCLANASGGYVLVED